MIIDGDKDQVDLRERMGRDRLRLAMNNEEAILWHREGEWRKASADVILNLLGIWMMENAPWNVMFGPEPVILYWEQCRPIQSPTGLSI